VSVGETGQVTHDAAEIYEEHFVPALFGQWALRVVDAANIQAGQRVLDVACGTGVLARAVAEIVGAGGTVTGLDVNEGMLAVARRNDQSVEWRLGRAEALPFDNDAFDTVVSQFGLMYFEDRRAALAEMLRVLRPGGGLAVAVWASLDEQPGCAALIGLLARLLGEQVAGAKRAPFVVGERSLLQALFDEAGAPEARITTQAGTAGFPSIASWIHTEIRGFTLANVIDDAQLERLTQQAETIFRPFVTAHGTVELVMSAHLITVTKG
jgi:ubiquinone/menaquinone biosynthesis C-methylase UbiE